MPINLPGRCRDVSPDHFMDEVLAECSFVARWVFVGLATLADREGRIEDRRKPIKARLLPYNNDVNLDDCLSELEQHRLIHSYEVAGGRYIEIENWRRWQNPEGRQDALWPDPTGAVPPNLPKGNKRPPTVMALSIEPWDVLLGQATPEQGKWFVGHVRQTWQHLVDTVAIGEQLHDASWRQTNAHRSFEAIYGLIKQAVETGEQSYEHGGTNQ